MSAGRLGRGLLAPSLALLAFSPLGCPPATGQTQPAAGTLASCAAIPDPMQRLACYDALAGRVAPPTPGSARAPVPAQAAAPAGVAAAPAAAASSPPAAVPPVSTASESAAAAGAPAAPPLSPQQAFGLYRAEHPASTELQSISARVTGIHTSPRGRPVVDLDGGQSWELDGADPLLAPGDLVTIRRASLGSFILTTPTKRLHRAYRLN